jgi:hypothetical protein
MGLLGQPYFCEAHELNMATIAITERAVINFLFMNWILVNKNLKRGYSLLVSQRYNGVEGSCKSSIAKNVPEIYLVKLLCRKIEF